jgi:hypothetical protein
VFLKWKHIVRRENIRHTACKSAPALSVLFKTLVAAAAFISFVFFRSFTYGAKVALSGKSDNGHYQTRLVVMQLAIKRKLPAR